MSNFVVGLGGGGEFGIFLNFFIFDGLKYFLNEYIFLQFKKRDFSTKSKKSVFLNSLSTSPCQAHHLIHPNLSS